MLGLRLATRFTTLRVGFSAPLSRSFTYKLNQYPLNPALASHIAKTYRFSSTKSTGTNELENSTKLEGSSTESANNEATTDPDLDFTSCGTSAQYELKIKKLLSAHLSPQRISVEDISGGCGSMFAIVISSAKFKGLTPVKQQKLVYEILGDEVHKWHGLQLRTGIPK